MSRRGIGRKLAENSRPKMLLRREWFSDHTLMLASGMLQTSR